MNVIFILHSVCKIVYYRQTTASCTLGGIIKETYDPWTA